MKLSIRCSYKLIIAWVIALWTTFSHAQERPSILAGHGTLSGSILPLWVATEAGLFEKHGLQVKPIYLPRAAGRAALISGDIQVYFSAGPPLVQMRQGGADIALHCFRDTEVHQFYFAFVGNQDVLRRNIAMNEVQRLAIGSSFPVRIIQSAGDF